MDFSVKRCKTKHAFEAELAVPAALDFSALKGAFEVEAEAGPILVLADFGGVIVHRFGKLTFKTLTDQAALGRAAHRIFATGIPVN